GKASNHVRPDRLEFEQSGKAYDRELVDRNGEMVGPEMNQPFDKRASRGERSVEPRRVHNEIILADALTEIALERISLRAIRLSLAIRRHGDRLKLALGTTSHALLG